MHNPPHPGEILMGLWLLTPWAFFSAFPLYPYVSQYTHLWCATEQKSPWLSYINKQYKGLVILGRR